MDISNDLLYPYHTDMQDKAEYLTINKEINFLWDMTGYRLDTAWIWHRYVRVKKLIFL